MSRRLPIVIALAALLVGFFAGWYLREQRDIDACLDSGGKWESPGGYCINAVFLSPSK